MSLAKLALPAIVATVALAGCGSITVHSAHGSRGRVDDALTTNPNHVKCLRNHHLPVQVSGTTRLQIGALPAGPTVVFTPSGGAAEEQQIEGKAQGAELIGSALLYPHGASDSELTTIENCIGLGVVG